MALAEPTLNNGSPTLRRADSVARRTACWHWTHGSPKPPLEMQFLKTLFWALVAALAVLFGARNWADVSLNLWGDIQADIKIPLLLLAVFLIGMLPTWLIMRAKLWAAQRRLDALERQNTTPVTAPPMDDGEPVI